MKRKLEKNLALTYLAGVLTCGSIQSHYNSKANEHFQNLLKTISSSVKTEHPISEELNLTYLRSKEGKKYLNSRLLSEDSKDGILYKANEFIKADKNKWIWTYISFGFVVFGFGLIAPYIERNVNEALDKIRREERGY